MTSVSVVIPAWNEANTLPLTLKALLRLDWLPESLELIVVAGGDDGTFEVAGQLSDLMSKLGPYHLLEQGPEGKNAAIQAGIAASTKQIIVLLDADTIVAKKWLKRLVAPIEQAVCDLAIANPIPIKSTFVSEYYMVEKAYTLDSITTYSGHAMAFKADDVVGRLDHFFPKDVKVGVDYFFARRFLQEGGHVHFAKDALVATHYPSTLKYFFRVEQRWLSARLRIEGVRLDGFMTNAGVTAGLVFTVPFSNFLFLAAVIFHLAYTAKRIHVWRCASRRYGVCLRQLPGFILLSYAHHIIGFLAHIRYFSGISKKDFLCQGERH